MYTKKHEFWHDDLCLDLVNGDPSTKVQLFTCHKLGGNQKWEHDRVSATYNNKGACVLLCHGNIFGRVWPACTLTGAREKGREDEWETRNVRGKRVREGSLHFSRN